MLNLIDKTVQGVCIALFTAIFLIITAQIVCRYLFTSPLIWTEEAARILFIWLCFLGGTVVHRNRTHIAVDYFVERAPEKAVPAIRFFLRILVILFLLFLCISGYELARRSSFINAITLPWISWKYIYYSVPVSAAIMLLYSLAEIIPQPSATSNP